MEGLSKSGRSLFWLLLFAPLGVIVLNFHKAAGIPACRSNFERWW
jgi:hypothetical protein